MSSRARLAPGLAVLVATLGCGTANEPAAPASSSLPAGIVARVEGESISVFAVAQIAERQRLEPRAALSRALSDALFAAAARATLPVAVTSSIERSAAARGLLEQIAADSAAAGPPSDAELADLLRERWPDLDRPEAVRTTHAVVINEDARRDAAARTLAEKIAVSVKDASSAEQFTSLAEAVPAEGFEVKAEALPIMTADGRGLARADKGFVAASSFDREFARAANQLQQPGELSPVVKTRFGYHVIRLEERIPASAVPKAGLPALLGPELQTRRAARQRRELLEKLRRASTTQIDRAVDELTARVQPSP